MRLRTPSNVYDTRPEGMIWIPDGQVVREDRLKCFFRIHTHRMGKGMDVYICMDTPLFSRMDGGPAMLLACSCPSLRSVPRMRPYRSPIPHPSTLACSHTDRSGSVPGHAYKCTNITLLVVSDDNYQARIVRGLLLPLHFIFFQDS